MKLDTTVTGDKTDVIDTIREYFKTHDPAHKYTGKSHLRSFEKYYLSSNMKLWVALYDKVKGFDAQSAKNRADKVEIYCENDEHVWGIAKALNYLWEKEKRGAWATLKRGRRIKEGGMFANLDWEKIKKAFNVGEDECKATWNRWLQPGPTQPSSPPSTPSSFEIPSPPPPTTDPSAYEAPPPDIVTTLQPPTAPPPPPPTDLPPPPPPTITPPSPFTSMPPTKTPPPPTVTPPSPFSSVPPPATSPAAAPPLKEYRCPGCDAPLSTQKIANLQKGLSCICENCFEVILPETI